MCVRLKPIAGEGEGEGEEVEEAFRYRAGRVLCHDISEALPTQGLGVGGGGAAARRVAPPAR